MTKTVGKNKIVPQISFFLNSEIKVVKEEMNGSNPIKEILSLKNQFNLMLL
jgi:hypothetical protein